MCGIAGVFSLNGEPIPELGGRLAAMSHLIAHRGPDGEGTWRGPSDRVGFVHRRLAIIDLVTGAQPMVDEAGQLKRSLRAAFAPILPADTLSSHAALSRPYVDNKLALAGLTKGAAFGRGFWGLLSPELWQQEFHDRASEFRSLPETLSQRVTE